MAKLPVAKKPKKPAPLKSEYNIGGRILTNGWGVFYEKGKVLPGDERESDKFYNLRTFTVELDNWKDPKELRTINENAANISSEKPSSYIYGKLNSVYVLKFGMGFRRMIAGKPEQDNVSVHYFASGGLSFAFLKPYYLDAYVFRDNTQKSISYADTNRSTFLDPNLIIGRSSFFEGIGNTKFVPGLHGKAGLHFDFSKNNKGILAIEAGISAELYAKSIAIMVSETPRPYNINLFAGFQFGKRK